MKSSHRARAAVSAERIARLADAGKDVSRFFTNRGRMMPAIRSVEIDFALDMLEEIDQAAAALHISRQALIKALVRQGLDQRLLAKRAKRVG